MADERAWDRRSLLRGAAVVAGAAATVPLLGQAALAQAGGSDADALFTAGMFEQAGRAYEEILERDPANLHAARQRGYVGLLANKFPEAEKYLTMALTLAPGDGMIGTWVFYHLLTTFDYAGRSLILRRRTPETASKVRADAQRAGAEPPPLWLAREHVVHSRGSIAGSGARVVGVNVGGTGEATAGMPGETAKQLGVRTDYDRPIQTFAHSHPATAYPCYPKEIRLGDAVATEVYCETDPNMPVNVPWPYGPGFDVVGHFDHCFYKPYNITLDFTGMNLYIARGKAT